MTDFALELQEIRERLDRLERFVGLVDPAPLPPLELPPLDYDHTRPEAPADVAEWIVRTDPLAASPGWAAEDGDALVWRWRDEGDPHGSAMRFLEAWVVEVKKSEGRALRLVIEPADWPEGVSPVQAARVLWRWLVLAAAIGLEIERPAAEGPAALVVAAIERDILGRTIRQCAILTTGEVWVDAP